MKARRPNESPRSLAAAQRTRTCAVSRQTLPERALLRFVVGPDGQVVPDLSAKLPGRGIWIEANADAIDLAVQRQVFARSARTRATAPATLSQDVTRLLRQRCLDLVGLAAKAGQAVSGFEKVKQLARAGRAAVLVEASDGSADGRGKIAGVGSGVPLVGAFTGAELGLALGREIVVHAALTKGGLARKFLSEIHRLSGFCAICPASWDVSEREDLLAAP